MADLKSNGQVQVESLGLTILYEPLGQIPKADLVFIHGLQGHPWRTWRHKKKSKGEGAPSRTSLSRVVNFNSQLVDKDARATRVYWPAELLPRTHGNVRVLTYGYDSHVSKWFSGPTNKMSISQHALSLLNDLSRKRQDCCGRPLIFVVHSLGGLVAKAALIEAQKQKFHDQLYEVYTSCEGIIFFGTPHRGSGAAKWGVVLSNIASAAQFDTHKEILKDLASSSDSHTLEELRCDFNDILDQGRIQIHTFQEGTGVAGLKIAGGKIVPDESSSFESRRFEVRDTIHANHMDMCRFETESDDGYQKFCGALANFLRRISESSGPAAERMKAQRKDELLHSLEFAERRAREEQLRIDDAATFEWIWSARSHNREFEHWLSSGGSQFWISGKPGSGRGKGNNFDGLLRALLVQLVQNVPELTTRILELGKDHFNENDCLDWPEAKLRFTLLDSLQASPYNVCIFVDGLDEYQGNMLELVKLLMEIGDSCASLPHKIKLCLASRPEPLLTTALEGSTELRMQDHNHEGIARYVSSTLRLVPAAVRDAQFTEISSQIAKRSDGVFLWARLAMNDLIEGFADGDSKDELLDRLEHVPRDMKDVYTRIFDRLSDAKRAEANLILLLVCRAKRILTVSELYVAIATAQRDNPQYDQDDLSPSKETLKSFRRRVLARSGGLLELVEDKKGTTFGLSGSGLQVKLIHETVRPFVENRQSSISYSPDMQESAGSYALWLRACVAIAKVVISKEGTIAYWGRSPLHSYALQYIFDHARDLEVYGEKSSYNLLRDVMGSKLHEFHQDKDCFWCHGKLFAEGQSRAKYPGTWLWALYHGLPMYCESSFLHEKAPAVGDTLPISISLYPYLRNVYEWSQSNLALSTYIKATVLSISVMMKSGVCVEDKHIIDALRAAPPQILDVLLKARTPGALRLQSSEENFGGPFWMLMCAEYEGVYFRRTVDYLIRRGENVNDNSGPAGTALHAPLWELSSSIHWRYEFLLNRGANPNIRGPAGTPLALAWKRAIRGRLLPATTNQYQMIMELLLKFGSRIDWVDDDGSPPTKEEILAYCHFNEAYLIDKKVSLREAFPHLK